MSVGTQIFTNFVGTPANPCFAEYAIAGHSIESDGGSRAFYNILHFARVTGPGTMTEAQLYTAISALLEPSLSAALSITYLADNTYVRFMDDPLRLRTANANGIVGAVTGDRLPNFNAVVTRKYTYGRGRSFRGSNHWGPIAESQTLLDNLTAGAFTLWHDVDLALLSLVNVATPDGSTWTLCVLSQTLSNLTSSPSLFTGSLIRDVLLNHRLGTMKRRKDRTGSSL